MSEFKLEAGKKYVDRRGRVYGPLVFNTCYFGEAVEDHTWNPCGRVNSSHEFDIDLVAEYVEKVEPVEEDCARRLAEVDRLIQEFENE